MSIFSKIMTKVFAVYPDAELKRTTEQVMADKQKADLHAPAPSPAPVTTSTQTTENPPEGTGADQAAEIRFPTPEAAAPTPVSATPVSAPAAQVDVAASLDKLAKENDEDLDWKKSIVDLLKLIDMDSSLGARRELADELGYKGDKGDTATMNVWLHKQVLVKLSQNGGKVPANLIT